MDSHDLQTLLTDASKRLSSPFCCGGSFQPLRPIRLAFKRNDRLVESEMCCMELPTRDDDTIGKLSAACSEASFGKGSETVIDPLYRKSLKLERKDFLTSFELHSSKILDEVKRVLAPSKDFITAQLYKLNVYRPGDFFKPHVDTPRFNSFASLVISLPMAFTGGELVVEHKRLIQCFDWSSNNNNPMLLHWAAFYSDCKHEVKELTSGYRIVLTYNLYHDGKGNWREQGEAHIKSWIKKTELYSTLCWAKESYEGERVTLGFPCSHLYPLLLHCENKNYRNMADQVHMLKGEDFLLYVAAQSAGLKPRLCRFWQPGDEIVYEGDEVDRLVVDPNFNGIPMPNYGSLFDTDKVSKALEFLSDYSRPIQWCTLTDYKDFGWQMGGAYGAYGNEVTTEALYCIIAILIDF